MRCSLQDRSHWQYRYRFWVLGNVAIILMVAGCGSDPETEATSELATSFESSPAKEDVMAAKTAFEEGRYEDAVYSLHKVVSRGDLSERQKKAVAGIVGQVIQAVHNDPQLNADPKLHRMIEMLIMRTLGEP